MGIQTSRSQKCLLNAPYDGCCSLEKIISSLMFPSLASLAEWTWGSPVVIFTSLLLGKPPKFGRMANVCLLFTLYTLHTLCHQCSGCSGVWKPIRQLGFTDAQLVPCASPYGSREQSLPRQDGSQKRIRMSVHESRASAAQLWLIPALRFSSLDCWDG